VQQPLCDPSLRDLADAATVHGPIVIVSALAATDGGSREVLAHDDAMHGQNEGWVLRELVDDADEGISFDGSPSVGTQVAGAADPRHLLGQRCEGVAVAAVAAAPLGMGHHCGMRKSATGPFPGVLEPAKARPREWADWSRKRPGSKRHAAHKPGIHSSNSICFHPSMAAMISWLYER